MSRAIIDDIAKISTVLNPVSSKLLTLPPMDLPQSIILMRRSPERYPSSIPIIHPDLHMLVLTLRGSGAAVINKIAFNLRPQEALLVFPHQFHHFTGLGKHDFLWLFCSFKLTYTRDIVGLKNNPVPIQPEMWPMIQALVRDYCNPDNMRPRRLADIAVNLWLLLLNLADYASANPREPTVAPEHPVRDVEFLEKLQTFLLDHLHEQISAEQIARHLGISRRCLFQRFNSVIGVGLHKHLLQMRMQQACRLICTTDLSLSQIADKVGYSSVFSFSRAFKRAYRKSPSAYRKASKG
jgi:AraC-like DNA-binding protein